MAASVDLTIEQGADFVQSIFWREDDDTPVILTGYSARMQVRERAQSPDPIVSLTSTPDPPDPPTIILEALTGEILLEVPAAITAELPTGAYVYDLEIVEPTGAVSRLLEGRCYVSPEVTR